jgi:D-glycero-alpha-D-manno-heptose-7-phosphate kinase
MYVGISPVRISFAGGGTDMPEYYLKHKGIVITSAINHFTYVTIHKRNDKMIQIFSPDFQTHTHPINLEKLQAEKGTELPIAIIKYLKYNKGLNLTLSSDVPPQSGLGSSSSLAVNLVNVISNLKNKKKTKTELAETSHYIEKNILHWPMGIQDEYIASFGGFKKIEFEAGKKKVTTVKINQKTSKELQENLLLFFIGSRQNTKILPTQLNNIRNNEEKTLESLELAKELAHTMYEQLKNSDLTGFGKLLNDGWFAKKQFSKNVTNEKIDRIYEKAIKSGALGGKLTGAGGGGHLLLYCEKSKQSKVLNEMTKLKIKQVKFNFETEGAKVLNLYNYANSK